MSTVSKEQIVLAAVSAAGTADANFESRVGSLAGQIALMLDERSSVMRRLTRFTEATPFVRTIAGGAREESSNRLLVRFVETNDKGEQETIRTDRLDTPEGQEMNQLIRGLKGHRALIYKFMEKGKDGREYRVLVHAVDLGPASEQPAQAA